MTMPFFHTVPPGVCGVVRKERRKGKKEKKGGDEMTRRRKSVTHSVFFYMKQSKGKERKANEKTGVSE